MSEGQTKICKCCRSEFRKNPKYSATQWANAVYCSTVCTGTMKKGGAHSVEAREKMRKAHKGTSKPWAGRYKKTEWHREIISKGVRRRLEIDGDEIRKKLSEAATGRRHTEEAKAKMREAFRQSDRYKGGEETILKRKAFYERQRNIKKMGNGGSHSIEEWEALKERFGYKCPRCLRKEPVIKLTEDHIIPVSMGGSNNIGNIQPLCQQCNSVKNAKAICYVSS